MPHIDIKLDRIPFEKPVRVEHNGMAIVVIRNRQGVSAFRDRCPHAQWRLSEGEVVNGILECPGHGWGFNASTGACVTVPAYCLKPLSVCPQVDSVRIEWEQSASEIPVEIARP